MWKNNAAWEVRSARYPGGVRQYCLLLVEDFLPERCREIARHMAMKRFQREQALDITG